MFTNSLHFPPIHSVVRITTTISLRNHLAGMFVRIWRAVYIRRRTFENYERSKIVVTWTSRSAVFHFPAVLGVRRPPRMCTKQRCLTPSTSPFDTLPGATIILGPAPDKYYHSRATITILFYVGRVCMYIHNNIRTRESRAIFSPFFLSYMVSIAKLHLVSFQKAKK